MEKWRTYSQNQKRVSYIKYAFERCINNFLKLCFDSFFNRSMSLLIFQNTFVVMGYLLVKGGYASVRIGGVMVMTIVEMDPTKKIVVVRKFFIFPFFVMFILCLNEIFEWHCMRVETRLIRQDVLPTVALCRNLQVKIAVIARNLGHLASPFSISGHSLDNKFLNN